jgi:phage terminase large subunit-like protein
MFEIPEIPSGDDPVALQRYLQQLSPAARKKVAEALRVRMSAKRQAWYCGDRTCDGQPHDGYDYKHARGSKREDERGSQYPPQGTDWITWLMLAGRGSGKSATGSRYTSYISRKVPYLGLIGPTGPTLRNVMIEGPSGLIKACEAAGEYVPGMYEPSKQRFTFASGAVATLFTAEEPERIRGSNLAFVWGDEPAFWSDPQAVWDMMMFALRAGTRPHVLATTTPLPTDFVKGLVAKPTTRVITGSTYDNRANLPPLYFQQILDEFEGTYLGRQEIYGEIIDDRVGALWSSTQFMEEDFYFNFDQVRDTLDRVLVGIDPAGSQNKRSDDTGIIVGGKRGEVLHMLDDFTGKFSPDGWARAAINAYEKYNADAIVVERNYGGDMCRATLKSAGFEGRIIEAKATDGKRVRAAAAAAACRNSRARWCRGCPARASRRTASTRWCGSPRR